MSSKESKIQCPYCGSNDTFQVSRLGRRCNSCRFAGPVSDFVEVDE